MRDYDPLPAPRGLGVAIFCVVDSAFQEGRFDPIPFFHQQIHNHILSGKRALNNLYSASAFDMVEPGYTISEHHLH